jgi:K+ transporter
MLEEQINVLFIMADWFQPIGIIIATLAVIASQAFISGHLH